jgi:hypothetical protein
MAWGWQGQKNVRRAVRRVLRKIRSAKFNCVEITEISARHFLGLPYVHVSAHSRHIQKTSFYNRVRNGAAPNSPPVGLSDKR